MWNNYKNEPLVIEKRCELLRIAKLANEWLPREKSLIHKSIGPHSETLSQNYSYVKMGFYFFSVKLLEIRIYELNFQLCVNWSK